jgi:hypothetical protein
MLERFVGTSARDIHRIGAIGLAEHITDIRGTYMNLRALVSDLTVSLLLWEDQVE